MVIPSTPYDAKGLLISSIRDPDPTIFMEPKRVYRAIKEEVPAKPKQFMGHVAIDEQQSPIVFSAGSFL